MVVHADFCPTNQILLPTPLHMDTKVIPTDDTDYSCHIKAIQPIISHHITPLVINSLWGRRTHAHRHSQTEAILRNQDTFQRNLLSPFSSVFSSPFHILVMSLKEHETLFITVSQNLIVDRCNSWALYNQDLIYLTGHIKRIC